MLITLLWRFLPLQPLIYLVAFYVSDTINGIEGDLCMNVKLLFMSLLFVLSIMTVSHVSAATFTDVSDDKYYSEAVNELHKQGHINGYVDGTFKPHAIITRAEVAMLVSKFSGRSYEVTNAYQKSLESDGYFGFNIENFVDVKIGKWYFDSISSLAIDEVIEGYPTGEFKPNEALTRGDFAIIISKAFTMQFEPKETKFEDIANHYGKKAIMQLEQMGFINGAKPNQYVPNANITRAEVAKILYRVHNYMHFNETYTNVDVNYYDLLVDTGWVDGQPPKIDDSGTFYYVKGTDWESFKETLPTIETQYHDYKRFKTTAEKNYIVRVSQSTCGKYVTKAFINDQHILTVNSVFPEYEWLKKDVSFLRCELSISTFVEIIEVPKDLPVNAIRYTFYPFHFSHTNESPVIPYEPVS